MQKFSSPGAVSTAEGSPRTGAGAEFVTSTLAGSRRVRQQRRRLLRAGVGEPGGMAEGAVQKRAEGERRVSDLSG